MRGLFRLALGASCILVLHGCAPAYETRFSKTGISAAGQERDSGHCWRLAQKHNVPEDVAGANILGAFIGGGIFGAIGAATAIESQKADPKNAYRRKAHDDCMVKRGYAMTKVPVKEPEKKGWEP